MFKHPFSYYYVGFLFLGALLVVLFAPTVTGQDETVRYAPGDHIREDQIQVYSDHVVLDVEGALWAKFEATGSMIPFFDEGAHALQVRPQQVTDIHVGDIISYTQPGNDYPVVHRVVFIGEDALGTYFIVKGDNNAVSDPGKVRFRQVQSIVVAIIY